MSYKDSVLSSDFWFKIFYDLHTYLGGIQLLSSHLEGGGVHQNANVWEAWGGSLMSMRIAYKFLKGLSRPSKDIEMGRNCG